MGGIGLGFSTNVRRRVAVQMTGDGASGENGYGLRTTSDGWWVAGDGAGDCMITGNLCLL